MRNMKFAKRIGAVVLAVCMVLSCAGCGGSSNKEHQKKQQKL